MAGLVPTPLGMGSRKRDAKTLYRSPHRDLSQKAKSIAAEEHCFLPLRQSEQTYFLNLHARMQPRTVRAEDDLVRTGTLHCLDDIVESPHPGGVAIHIGVVHELIHGPLVSAPI